MKTPSKPGGRCIQFQKSHYLIPKLIIVGALKRVCVLASEAASQESEEIKFITQLVCSFARSVRT